MISPSVILRHARSRSPWLRHPFTLAAIAASSLGLSVLLTQAHIQAVAAVRETSLPLLASLPTIERRLSVLTEQVEVAELDAALKTGSQLERVRMSILPAQTKLDRTLASFEALRTDLADRGVIGILSPIEVKPEVARPGGFLATPLAVHITLRGEGVEEVLAFLKLAGLLTIGDALIPAEKGALIHATEEENPTAIVALEQFFSADLLSYAREPRPIEEQLRRSLPGEGFQVVFRTVTEQSLLRSLKDLMARPFGKTMEQLKLWPMQFISIDRLELTSGAAEGWYRLDLTLSLLRRSV